MWPDVTRLCVTYLDDRLPDAWVASRLPSMLDDRYPVVRVTRGPGSDDTISDEPLVDVEAFTPDESSMWEVAERVREAMHDLAGRAVDGALVDMVRTTSSPTRVDYAPDVFRAVATYRLALRKRPSWS